MARCGSVIRSQAIEGGTVLSVLAWFQADLGTNQIKQREIVPGQLCGFVVQWSVLAWYGRGPGFQSWSGYALFPPLAVLNTGNAVNEWKKIGKIWHP